MKNKIVFLLTLLFLTSCFNNNNSNSNSNSNSNNVNNSSGTLSQDTMTGTSKSQSGTSNIENRVEKIDSKLELTKNGSDLVDLYHKDKNFVETIVAHTGGNQYEGKRRFLDGLQTCSKLVVVDFDTTQGKKDIITIAEIEDLYKYVLLNDFSLNDYLDENGKILLKHQKGGRDEKESIVMALFLAGKLDKETTIKELRLLSQKYKNTELSNSILLKILQMKISGLSVTEKTCENEFLAGYKNIKL